MPHLVHTDYYYRPIDDLNNYLNLREMPDGDILDAKPKYVVCIVTFNALRMTIWKSD